MNERGVCCWAGGEPHLDPTKQFIPAVGPPAVKTLLQSASYYVCPGQCQQRDDGAAACVNGTVLFLYVT
jgi:hypothetical protein